MDRYTPRVIAIEHERAIIRAVVVQPNHWMYVHSVTVTIPGCVVDMSKLNLEQKYTSRSIQLDSAIPNDFDGYVDVIPSACSILQGYKERPHGIKLSYVLAEELPEDEEPLSVYQMRVPLVQPVLLPAHELKKDIERIIKAMT